MLQNMINSKADCYVGKSNHSIICNRNVYLSCEKVFALKQTELSVLDKENLYDHETDDSPCMRCLD